MYHYIKFYLVRSSNAFHHYLAWLTVFSSIQNLTWYFYVKKGHNSGNSSDTFRLLEGQTLNHVKIGLSVNVLQIQWWQAGTFLPQQAWKEKCLLHKSASISSETDHANQTHWFQYLMKRKHLPKKNKTRKKI